MATRSKKFRGHLSVACVVLALAISACTPAGGSSKDGNSITILYSPVVDQVGVWAAQEEGMFAKYGLKVKLSSTTDATQVATGISGGSAQLGFETGTDFLSAASAGVKLVAASGLSIDTAQNPRLELFAGTNSGISSPADLAGKRIAVAGVNTRSQLATIDVLKRTGVEARNIKWVSMPFQQMPDALKARRVDAVVSVYPFIGLLKSQGYQPIIGHYAEGDEKQLVIFLSASADWASKNPKALGAVRQALKDADAFVEQHPVQARTIIEKYTGLSAGIVNNMPFPTLSTELTPDQLGFYLHMMKDQGLIQNNLDLSPLIAK